MIKSKLLFCIYSFSFLITQVQANEVVGDGYALYDDDITFDIVLPANFQRMYLSQAVGTVRTGVETGVDDFHAGYLPGLSSLLHVRGMGTYLHAQTAIIGDVGPAGVIVSHGASFGGSTPIVVGPHGYIAVGGDYNAPPAEAGFIRGAGIEMRGGRFYFNHNSQIEIRGSFTGHGYLGFLGPGLTVLTADDSGFDAYAFIDNGRLVMEGALGGFMHVVGGRLEGNGSVGATLHSGGVIAPGFVERVNPGTFTINGDYTSNRGVIEIETMLGDDSSSTDRLVVKGDTSGTADVHVLNVGGTGAQTVEGIKIIDVLGASNGLFSLNGDYVFEGEHAVIAGAYAYQLRQNGVATPEDGDWYLRSTYVGPLAEELSRRRPPRSLSEWGTPIQDEPVHIYQPGVPLYEAYPQTLLALSELPTLRQRVGHRRDDDVVDRGIRGRVEGYHSQGEAYYTSSWADLEIDTSIMQVRLDRTMHEDATGNSVVAGVTAHLGKARASVESLFGHGTIDSHAYGLGSTLTYTGSNGVYLDAQAQVSWFRSDLDSHTLGGLVTNNHGWGYATGLEVGKQIALNSSLSLVPQAQLVYANVDFDSFTDPKGALVHAGNSHSLMGRAGIGFDAHRSWQNASGRLSESHAYAIANLNYEFFDGTSVSVSAAKIEHLDQKLAAGVGLGGKYSWNNDQFTLHGEISANSLLHEYGGYSFKGSAGLTFKF